MRIIKPQQLAVLKNGYQIGTNSQLGISVIAGFYLSQTDHFVCEPQIWEAWKAAPLAVPYLDNVVSKPFAEVLLAGHAGIGILQTSLEVEMQVGAITRRWQIQGESRVGGLTVQPFMRIPLNHDYAWGGKACKENPLGRGYQGGMQPNLLERLDNHELKLCSPLAAPSPIPEYFTIRQQYIDKIAPIMSTKSYLDTTFPGLPEQLDRRYFQLSSPKQWLRDAVWPTKTPFQLSGFRTDNESIQGHFPKVKARAFLAHKAQSHLQELDLHCQTLWLLPDSDLGLMIFNTSLPLSHLMDEPYSALMVALDHIDAWRDTSHFCSVYQHRINPSSSPLAFLRDPELMPLEMSWNVIDSVDKHPSSLLYNNQPMDKIVSQTFYQQVEESIQSQPKKMTKWADADKHDKDNKDNKDKMKGNSINEHLIAECLLLSLPTVTEKKTFNAIDPFVSCWKGKTFKFCRFIEIDFSRKQIEECVFEGCQFSHCRFNECDVNHSHFLTSLFVECELNRSRWHQVSAVSSRFDGGKGQSWLLHESQLDQCAFEHMQLTNSQYNHSNLKGCVFNKTDLSQSNFVKGKIISGIFNGCSAKHLQFQEIKFEKSSILGGDWGLSQFTLSHFDHVTAGLEFELNQGVFNECHFHKVGFKDCQLSYGVWSNCSTDEINCDNANWQGAIITQCDFIGMRFKDSDLSETTWQMSSVQQGLFYNANLEGAKFKECNLIAANMGRIARNNDTQFTRCLLDEVNWRPTRAPTEALKETE